jgi:hypothetical protein
LSCFAYLLPQFNAGSFALQGRATAMRRAFHDQADCIRVRRDPNTIANGFADDWCQQG